MNSLKDFAARDLAKSGSGKSLIAKTAANIWARTLERCRPGYFESWAMAIVYACSGIRHPAHILPELKTPEFVNGHVAVNFYESILKHSNKLERDPLWREALIPGPANERMAAFLRFMDKCALLWRNDCIDAWRNLPGTFAYVHRRAQKSLRENLPSHGWSLYDPKSRYYGPAGLTTQLAIIDEQTATTLKSIPLPPDSPVSGKIFYADNVFKLAKWLYENMTQSRKDDSCVLSTRNFARWLCFQYPDLTPVEMDGNIDVNDLSMDVEVTDHSPKGIDAIANEAASALTPLQRKVILMTLEGKSAQEIAGLAGLEDDFQVMELQRQSGDLVHGICQKHSGLNDAHNPDLAYRLPDPQSIERLFMTNLIKHCKRLDSDVA